MVRMNNFLFKNYVDWIACVSTVHERARKNTANPQRGNTS